ncbi:MAG: VRR-NUC domain-containing protein [Dehalococcoidia bacterium]|jgi:hypothetical protein
MIDVREEAEQMAVMEWAEWMETQIPALRWLHHIPNGGHRSKAVAGKLKAAGVKRGVPDLCLPVPSYGWHGLYIEMKVEGRRPTRDQKKWLKHLSEAGYFTAVCYGADEAITVLKRYLGA